MKINQELSLKDLQPIITAFWELSGEKINLIEKEYDS